MFSLNSCHSKWTFYNLWTLIVFCIHVIVYNYVFVIIMLEMYPLSFVNTLHQTLTVKRFRQPISYTTYQLGCTIFFYHGKFTAPDCTMFIFLRFQHINYWLSYARRLCNQQSVKIYNTHWDLQLTSSDKHSYLNEMQFIT